MRFFTFTSSAMKETSIILSFMRANTYWLRCPHDLGKGGVMILEVEFDSSSVISYLSLFSNIVDIGPTFAPRGEEME